MCRKCGSSKLAHYALVTQFAFKAYSSPTGVTLGHIKSSAAIAELQEPAGAFALMPSAHIEATDVAARHRILDTLATSHDPTSSVSGKTLWPLAPGDNVVQRLHFFNLA
jgi:hypothetical protein